MIIYEISKQQIERAKKLYSFNNLKGSITKGKSQIYGALGEIIIYDIFKKSGFNVSFKSTYDYDLIINDFKIDVKTKRTSVIPKPYYLCSISNFNTNQKCDFYFFLRINIDFKYCYVLGYINKIDFFNKAIFNKKGTYDINGFVFKDDCYNLQIKMLNKFKTV